MTQEPVKKRKATAEELAAQYPSLTYLSGPPGKANRKAWVATFNARPDAMHNLLADFIKQVYATSRKVGQRPMPKEEAVDFQSLIYGEENLRPIHEVLPALVKVSERMFCSRINMSRSQYQRLLAGQYDPDVNEIRKIAEVLKKPPTFFVEYRKAMAIAAFINLIDDHPGIATSIYRQYLNVHM